MRSLRLIVLCTVVLIVSLGCIHIYEPRPQSSSGPGSASDRAAGEQKADKKKPFKPWKQVLKDTKKIEGLFSFHLKRDGKLYLELEESDLESDFGLVTHYSRGLGDYNVHAGLIVSRTRLMRFSRVGDTIYLIHRNPRFTAEPGTPIRRSIDQNTGHSVVAAMKIESQKDGEEDEADRLLVEATPFFVSDYSNVGERLKSYHGGKPVAFDSKRSWIERVQGFPRNVELDVMLTFKPASPPVFGGEGVSDYRSIPVGLRYSMFALPEEPMTPRPADDRVGHFLTAIEDFSRDQEETLYLRYANRWRLEKKDPEAAVSDPVQPIVYYVDRTVPEEYRQYVMEGIEAWQPAFEAAGFSNAIVAKQAPEDDESWSAEDIRYSTVQWTAAHSMGYAIGPSQVDPRTGEIVNADILLSSGFVRGWLNSWQTIGPEEMAARLIESERIIDGLPAEQRQYACAAQAGKAHQLALQYALLSALGQIPAGRPMPEEYLGDAIRDLVMHEVGHTLGLRHNFKASSAIPFEKLHDTTFTGTHGVSISVMDYNPVNIASDPEEQGHYWSKVVGDYDVWAIEYAYSEGSGPERDEAARLASIARRAAEPMLAYGTDEDSYGGPFAVDPQTVTWDLGSDPLAYARERASIVSRVKPQLEQRLISEGEGYQQLRGAYAGLLFERIRSVSPAVRVVGGLYLARDHKGDPDARLPFTPVPADTQREAVSFLVEHAFAEDAWIVEPEIMNKLAPNRWSHWGMNGGPDPTFPMHAFIMSGQASLLGQLMAPQRLSRLLDNELRVSTAADAYSVAELFEAIELAIWSELDGDRTGRVAVGSIRRNLQRMHVELLATLLLESSSPGASSIPADARSLARLSLSRVAAKIEDAEAESADTLTRAHLMEAGARATRALEASIALTHETSSF